MRLFENNLQKMDEAYPVRMGAPAKKQSRSFDDWMKLVDHYADQLSGMSSADLPDVAYADWYEQGMSPERAAKRAVRSAKDEE